MQHTSYFAVLLQWGRDFNVAESSVSCSIHHTLQFCFNGAATLTSRRGGMFCMEALVGFWLQWGRDFNVAESC